jgi:DNA-binding phage protein
MGKVEHMAKRVTSIVAELRKAIATAERRGQTRYQIAKVSGVDESQLSKLVNHQRIPRLDTAEKIVKAMGGRLVIDTTGR